MGLGVVLVIWFVLWMGVALFCSLVLGGFTWWLVRGATRGRKIRAVLAVALLPPVSVVCGLVGFVAYGLWCETVRGVDAGIGDSWRVSLGSGYQLEMIDTMEQAYIESPTHEQFGMGMTRVGFDDNAVYFGATDGTFQVIEKRSGRSSVGLTESDLAAKLRSIGSPGPTLRTPDQVYSSLRWGLADLLAVPMVLGLPALLSLGVGSYVWRIWRTARQPGAPDAPARPDPQANLTSDRTAGTIVRQEANRDPHSDDFRGRRFYSPDVIALYCIFSLPVGFALYGLNEARRGRRAKGYLLAGICGAVILATIIAPTWSTGGDAYGRAFFGIGLFRMEGGPYRRALLRGGVGARWWPPLLWILASILLVSLIATILRAFGSVK